ncbi:MAG: D-glycerate dehydrogenase [Sporomusaceae bacterium]|jgi:lactate dehydrogenase-like 2-hydroxyacid dehydrogenase|nr:D-glycerate dehydrogenase [Sporomusaceae bacterium]
MNKPSVYVTKVLPGASVGLLKERCEVEMAAPQELDRAEFLAKVKGRFAVVVAGGTKIDAAVCEAIKGECKILANCAVGYDNIDVAAATKCGIYVSNTPGVVTGATADLAFALILSLARNIVACDQYVRSGQKGWSPTLLMGCEVSGKTIGIIGGGRIGTAVGQRAKGFGMKIIYHSTKPNPGFEEATGGRFVTKETLLQEADFVSVNVPLLPTTRHLLGAADFKIMKKTAFLINTARGAVIDEAALAAALKNGEIAGAGLDVFEREPELVPGLAELDNVVLTPHVGTSTLETRIIMGEMCAANIFAVLDGKLPPNCINPELKGGN